MGIITICPLANFHNFSKRIAHDFSIFLQPNILITARLSAVGRWYDAAELETLGATIATYFSAVSSQFFHTTSIDIST